MLNKDTLKDEEKATAPKEENPSWSDGLPEELRSYGDIKESKSLEDFARRYQQHRSTLSKSIVMPSDEAGDEEMGEFYAKLQKIKGVARMPDSPESEGWADIHSKMGVPQDADGYRIEDKSLASKMFELNLSVNQATEMQKILGETDNVEREKVDAGYKDDMEKLRHKWGESFDKRAVSATKLVQEFGGEQAFAFLSESGEGNNPAMLEMMYALSKKMASGKLEASGNEAEMFGVDREGIKANIASMRNNPKDAFHDASHPDHRSRLKILESYYKKLG
jgi:hypothetical protein